MHMFVEGLIGGLDQDGPWRPLNSNIVKSLVRLFHTNYAMDQEETCLASFPLFMLIGCSAFSIFSAWNLQSHYFSLFQTDFVVCVFCVHMRLDTAYLIVLGKYGLCTPSACCHHAVRWQLAHQSPIMLWWGIIDYKPTRYNWSRPFTNTAQHAFEIACDELFIVRWKLGRGMPPRWLWTVCHLICKVPAAPFLASSGSSSCPESVWKTWSAKTFPRDRRSTQVTWVSMVPTWKVAWMLGLGKRSQSQATVNGRDNNQQYATHSNLKQSKIWTRK